MFVRLRGITAAEFPAGTRTTEVTVRLPEAEQTADFLAATLIRVAPGQFVPLGEIVTAETLRAFSTITRENGRRLVTVTGDLSEDNPARAAEIGALLQEDLLPDLATRYNLDWDLSGLAVQESSFLTDAFYGFLLCVVGIYLILGWILGSWTEPLIVVAVIPFGLIGTVLGHAQFDLAMSLFTVIGVIGMSGIIINDAIVLVTTVQDYAQTRPIAAAAIEGARERLRPILLTTLTTVLGLAPLMYEGSRQALFLKPTVVTLVYGLSVGFFVVLLVVPSLLVIRDDLKASLRSLHRLSTGRSNRLRRPLKLSIAVLIAVNVAIFGPWSAEAVQTGLFGLSGMALQMMLSAISAAVIIFGIGLVILRPTPGTAVERRE